MTGAVGTRYLLDLRRSPRRRSLSVEVHADLRVIVRAPSRCTGAVIEEFITSRAAWIERHLERFRLRGVRTAPTYTDGEAHAYLGEPYSLSLRPADARGVRIDARTLVVGGTAASDLARVAAALNAWYKARARAFLPPVIAQWHAHRAFARYSAPALTVRTMRSRWGSFCPQRGMTLNSLLMRAAPVAIEYVVVHELCHLRFHGHGRGFYGLLESVLPDWRKRQRLLEAGVT